MTVSERPEVEGVFGAPETTLPSGLLSQLPANLAEAPWEVKGDALMWVGRGGAAARSALAPSLRETRALATIGGFVRYSDTPVGTYNEVLGLVGAGNARSPWGSVAFMAVDSPASLVGGRTNWAMPKTLARFDGEIDGGGAMEATGEGPVPWQVTARARVIGPRVPMRSVGIARQQFPDGSVRSAQLRFRATMRPAIVTATVASEGPLGSWLTSGRFPGVVIESMNFSLDEARP